MPKETFEFDWIGFGSMIGTIIGACAAMIAAFWAKKIGEKQNEIGKKQNEINENLLDLQYAPSIELQYDKTTKQIQIHNKGNGRLWLSGTKVNENHISMESEARLITQAGFYFLNFSAQHDLILGRLRVGGETRIKIELFLKSENGKKYRSKHYLIFEKFADDAFNVRSQTIDFYLEDQE